MKVKIENTLIMIYPETALESSEIESINSSGIGHIHRYSNGKPERLVITKNEFISILRRISKDK